MPADRGPVVRGRPKTKPKVKARAKPNPDVFGPVVRADKPISSARARAHEKTAAARRETLKNATVPAIPRIKGATGHQRGVAKTLVAESLREQNITTNREIAALPKVQRQRANRGKGYATTQARQVDERLARAGLPRPLLETVKPGRPHTKVKVPGIATIDLTATGRTATRALKGNPLAAFYAGTRKLPKSIPGIPGRALQEAVDLPANTVTASYLIGKELAAAAKPGQKDAGEHLRKAAGMVVDPFVETAKHPIKSFTEHPLNTLLIGSAAKGAVGRTTGAALRKGAAGQTGRRLASTKRAPLTIQGVEGEVNRQYSRDIITKGGQVALERAQKRKGAKRGTGPVTLVRGRPTDRVTSHQLRRVAAEDVQAAKVISSQDVAATGKEVKKAVGGRPSAAVRLRAEGIATSRADLQAYLAEIRAQAASGKLNPDELALNRDAQKRIEKALARNHTDADVAAAASAYSDVSARLERELIEARVVPAKVAEEARLTGAAVRLGATGDKRTARAQTKQARADAYQAHERSKRAREKAERDYLREVNRARLAKERTRTGPQVRAAEGDLRAARASLAKARKEHQANVAELGVARGRAQILSRNVGGEGAEILARSRTVPEGTNQFAAGGHGVELAAANARASTARLRDAKATVAKAEATVKARRDQLRQIASAKEYLAMHRAGRERRAAKLAARDTRAAFDTAKAADVAVWRAPWVTREGGQPVTVEQVRAAMGPGAIEPAFVSHQRGRARVAALPLERPGVAAKQQRLGTAVETGALDLHPARLAEQAMESQRLISAARSRESAIDRWGYRVDGEPKDFASGKAAEAWARDEGLHAQTGHAFAAVQRGDGRWQLIPDEYAGTLKKLAEEVQQHPAAKAITSNWRRNVLAFNPRWFAGNMIEAAFRAAIAGAGPVSYATAKKTLGHLTPEMRQQVQARTTRGGHLTSVEQLAHEVPGARELGGFAQAASRFAEKPGPRQVGQLVGAYTRFVMEILNGKVEHVAQTAMLGKALKQHPLMNERIWQLSEKATQEAAMGLRNTATQAELGRAVDRMYGQYAKFGPGVRQAITLYTPFLSWTMNSVNFLYNVLPRDHPVLTGQLAAINQSTEEERKALGLYLDPLGKTKGQVAPWLMGSIPRPGGGHLRLARYTPFGLLNTEGAAPWAGVQELVLPQYQEILLNLMGRDWSNKPLSEDNNAARNLLAAVTAFTTSQIPLASQALRVAGVKPPQMRDTQEVTPDLGTRAREVFDPFRTTPAKKDSSSSSSSSRGGSGVRVRPVKIKPIRVKPIRLAP